MRLSRKIGLVALLLVAVYFGGNYTWAYLLHFRHKLQEQFAEMHSAINGDGEDASFGQGTLTDAQLAARDNTTAPIQGPPGALDWKLLAKTGTHYVKVDGADMAAPIYSKEVQALNHQTVTVKGFMFPLDQLGKQTHFLLSPYPPSCPFCLPAGPSELIEVKPKEPQTFTYDSMIIKGQFELIEGDAVKDGMFYRIVDAEVVGP